MIEQPELDLALSTSPAKAAAKPPRVLFGGFTPIQIMLGALIGAILVWSMWVTRALLAPKQDRIVSARLSAIVGDYVQAQARSDTPPSQVEAEMRAFMASLDKELERRSAKGEVILVGEAVLTKNVPDVTESLKNAVYASGVARPRQISAADLQRMRRPPVASAPHVEASMLPPQAGAGFGSPLAGDLQTIPSGSPLSPDGAPLAGATVSIFGGPDGLADR